MSLMKTGLVLLWLIALIIVNAVIVVAGCLIAQLGVPYAILSVIMMYFLTEKLWRRPRFKQRAE